MSAYMRKEFEVAKKYQKFFKLQKIHLSNVTKCTSSVTEQLIQAMLDSHLTMPLNDIKLSGFDLNSSKDLLIQYLHTNNELVSFDISWSKLYPKNLQAVLETISESFDA
mgnify:CR=1 FL=1